MTRRVQVDPTAASGGSTSPTSSLPSLASSGQLSGGSRSASACPPPRPPHVHDDPAQVRVRHAVLIARHGGEAEHPMRPS
jgi:hypothetical protein